MNLNSPKINKSLLNVKLFIDMQFSKTLKLVQKATRGQLRGNSCLKECMHVYSVSKTANSSRIAVCLCKNLIQAACIIYGRATNTKLTKMMNKKP